MDESKLTIGQCATLACLLEATAPKVGNVHRGADFADLTFTDFVVSAVAIGPAMDAAAKTGMGRAVHDAVAATQCVCSTNSNLGMALLIAPLAAVPREEALTTKSVAKVLSGLTADDSTLIYEAIRLARPGGLGKVEAMDVSGEAPSHLLDAMRAAAERDMIARQYTENFELVLKTVMPALVKGRERGKSLTDSIIHTHLTLIADHGDSLVARKCGLELSQKAGIIARQVIRAGEPGEESYNEALADFDFWLRSDGNRRNPGTTADLIAAGLFAGLRDGRLVRPWR
jgi:triphosphoribosyl-dephospho-CoA synthase